MLRMMTDSHRCTKQTHLGNVEVALTLINSGAESSVRARLGVTPLHLAALEGHAGLVRALVSAGADINCVDDEGVTPLHAAAVGGHSETVTRPN